MKGTEIGTFENINVQWVGGATPTAYFQNDKGETISETEIGDKSYEDLLLLFQEHHFTPKKKVYTYPESFSDVSEFGGHRYELFNSLNYFDAALEFAKSKNFNGEQGYMVTIESPEENEAVHLLLKKNIVTKAWLGAKDEEENVWRWISGPETGKQFWHGLSKGDSIPGVFSNWKEGEPNDVDGEDCASMLGEDGKWNDARCGVVTCALVIEYGSKPLVLPKSEL